MKNFFLHIIILLSFFCQAQNGFEGKIKFVNHIDINQKVPEGFEKTLNNKYGDSLEMIYSKKGFFKRRYINTGESGNDYQLYFPENGKFVIVKKNATKIDTGSVTVNSLKLKSFTQIKSEKIMNLDCDCYEYKTSRSSNGTEVILNYCFSKTLTKLDPILFKKHEDFFLSDFFRKSERPYLKFSMKVPAFTITYIATEIIEKPISDSEFK